MMSPRTLRQLTPRACVDGAMGKAWLESVVDQNLRRIRRAGWASFMSPAACLRPTFSPCTLSVHAKLGVDTWATVASRVPMRMSREGIP